MGVVGGMRPILHAWTCVVVAVANSPVGVPTTPRPPSTEAQLVGLLLSRGAKANSRDYRGRTPLHGAAEKGVRQVVVALLHAGADAHARDNNGWSVLHCAAARGSEEVVRIILSYSVSFGWVVPENMIDMSGVDPMELEDILHDYLLDRKNGTVTF